MVSGTLTRADQVDQDFATTLTALSTPDPQPGPSPAPPNPDQPVPTRSQQNRDDAVWASRTGRLRRGGGLRDNSVGGGDSGNKSDKLGPPVPGEHASMPGVDPWKYQGDFTTEGSGPHGQRSPTLKDIAVQCCMEIVVRRSGRASGLVLRHRRISIRPRGDHHPAPAHVR